MSKRTVPQAFFSYRRQVDEHDGSRITKLRERLQGEISAQTGMTIEIFQDIRGLKWGDTWHDKILAAAEGAYFLIPVITPGYFLSQPCREEYEAFKARGTNRKKASLILPVYYLETDELEDPAWREGNDWAAEIASTQWVDWRPLRLEPWEMSEPNKRIALMAKEFKERLKALGVLQPPTTTQSPLMPIVRTLATSGAPASAPQASDQTTRTTKASPSPRRRELIVDAGGAGQFRTITDAVRAAVADDVVLVKPGKYVESIVIDKSLTLLGDGPREETVVEATSSHVISFTAPFGRVANLTLRHLGGGNWYAVSIAAGRLELEGCDITSKSLACVAIHGEADPVVRRNRIHDGAASGVYAYENGRGTIEDNEIWGNSLSGVAAKQGADLIVRRNRIRDGKGGGVYVYESGRSTIDDNDISGNSLSGVATSEGADPIVRRNRIYDGKEDGVLIHTSGRGTFEDNEIRNNAYSGIEVRDAGQPTAQKNVVVKNREGIRVHKGGSGAFHDNDLRGNTSGPWLISKDCEGKITRSGNIEK